jgi:hypothetical protein
MAVVVFAQKSKLLVKMDQLVQVETRVIRSTLRTSTVALD